MFNATEMFKIFFWILCLSTATTEWIFMKLGTNGALQNSNARAQTVLKEGVIYSNTQYL